MPEVRCADVGAFTCKGHFRAESMEELLRQVAAHLRDRHEVNPPTQTFLNLFAKVSTK